MNARRPFLRIVQVVGLCVLVALSACGGGPSSPTPVPTPTPTPSPSFPFVTVAHLTTVLTGAPVVSAMVEGDGIGGGPSDGAGRLEVGALASSTTPQFVTLTQPNFVTREVWIKIPGDPTTVSLIPAAFDLMAFDQMFRAPASLRRWITAPPLRVQARVVAFTSTSASEATGLDEVMTDDEVATLEADLTWALPQLTGNTFAQFAGIERQTIDEGSRMSVLNTGMITVARYRGLQDATGYWGYTRWLYGSLGAVVGGTIMLDEEFDGSGSPYRRSLRAHELGHALGYNHVTVRASVMNSSAQNEPTAFDLEAARIAFARPLWNESPDRDPLSAPANRALADAGWTVGAGGGGT